jgi:uncharacterized protein YjbJ (UPF0337 family)
MNKDQIKGAVKETAGKVQSGVGKATGSTEQQVKGTLREAEGKVQKTAGNVRESLDDAADESRNRH